MEHVMPKYEVLPTPKSKKVKDIEGSFQTNVELAQKYVKLSKVHKAKYESK